MEVHESPCERCVIGSRGEAKGFEDLECLGIHVCVA